MAAPTNANEALQAIEDLGYTEGVATTILKNDRVQTSIGSITTNGADLFEALMKLLAALTALAKKDRPAATDATTRTVALPEDENGQREIVTPTEVFGG